MTQSPKSLEEIRKELKAVSYDDVTVDEALASINQLVLDVIGEDEDSNYQPIPGVGAFDIEKEAKNQLKAEQRQRWSKLKGGTK